MYALQPPDGALPHFFPTLYPVSQEPVESEKYAEIVEKLRRWRALAKVLVDVIEQMHHTALDDLKSKSVNRFFA